MLIGCHQKETLGNLHHSHSSRTNCAAITNKHDSLAGIYTQGSACSQKEMARHKKASKRNGCYNMVEMNILVPRILFPLFSRRRALSPVHAQTTEYVISHCLRFSSQRFFPKVPHSPRPSPKCICISHMSATCHSALLQPCVARVPLWSYIPCHHFEAHFTTN